MVDKEKLKILLAKAEKGDKISKPEAKLLLDAGLKFEGEGNREESESKLLKKEKNGYKEQIIKVLQERALPMTPAETIVILGKLKPSNIRWYLNKMRKDGILELKDKKYRLLDKNKKGKENDTTKTTDNKPAA